jgi:predicted glycogen debranching enzyme
MNETPSWTGWRRGEGAEALITREWLVTNGLGGYSTGTIGGIITRRYHGALVSALPILGRYVMLNHLCEVVRHASHTFALSGQEAGDGPPVLPDGDVLEEFRLEWGLPVWLYRWNGIAIEQRIVMPFLQNTTVIEYRVLSAPDGALLEITPAVSFRPHERAVATDRGEPCAVEMSDGWLSLSREGVPPLRLCAANGSGTFQSAPLRIAEFLYRIERSRGYEHRGTLWSPGSFTLPLRAGESVSFIATTEPWETLGSVSAAAAFDAERARRSRLLELARLDAEVDPLAAQLTLAADQFIITPATRSQETARLRAQGDEPRTVIAGYHWFTDWGRDTMISLEGLALVTGRQREAASILRTFASYVRDGLIPNMFPEGENEGLYHTADATLWFFHAVSRYASSSGDARLVADLLPVLHDIIDHHLGGTRFGIGVDPADGLLRQGAEGYQLTWMDAKVDGWVVTPRRGKAVEINALFYNALRLLEGWSRAAGDARAETLAQHADRVQRSFNARFWNEETGYLFDVVDAEGGGNDPACRPNQLFSISLDHPVLDPSRWAAVVETARRQLLTPVGLRSLSRAHPDYKPAYDGDLRARDAAYHQGTVWAWLIGPYVDAWLKVHPHDHSTVTEVIEGFTNHLSEACIGSISEIFDAEEPFTPRGCIAQAWSVAEVMRILRKVETSEHDQTPTT